MNVIHLTILPLHVLPSYLFSGRSTTRTRHLAALWTRFPALVWKCWAKLALDWYGLMPCGCYLSFGNASESNMGPLALSYGIAAAALCAQLLNQATAIPERIAHVLPQYIWWLAALARGRVGHLCRWSVGCRPLFAFKQLKQQYYCYSCFLCVY